MMCKAFIVGKDLSEMLKNINRFPYFVKGIETHNSRIFKFNTGDMFNFENINHSKASEISFVTDQDPAKVTSDLFSFIKRYASDAKFAWFTEFVDTTNMSVTNNAYFKYDPCRLLSFDYKIYHNFDGYKTQSINRHLHKPVRDLYINNLLYGDPNSWQWQDTNSDLWNRFWNTPKKFTYSPMSNVFELLLALTADHSLFRFVNDKVVNIGCNEQEIPSMIDHLKDIDWINGEYLVIVPYNKIF